MLNIYSTASSIERDWRNKNAEINKIFDDKSFDLNPKEFEEKCNKVLQDLISADSNLSIAKLLGINEDKIHQYIAENFNPSNQYEALINRLHLLIFDRESGTTTTTITFPDPSNPIYADDSLTGMPKVYEAGIAHDEILPFAKAFDRYFVGKMRFSALINLGLNPILSKADPEEFKTIFSKAPSSFFTKKTDEFFSRDSPYFSIPPSEKFRISSTVANAFGINLRDGSKLLNQYCSSAINATNYNISSCDLLKKSLAKIYWIYEDKSVAGFYYEGSINLFKNSKENFLPSEFTQYETIIHEFGHHLLYNIDHPNFNDKNQSFKYHTKENSDYFSGSLSYTTEDLTKVSLSGYLSLDDSCDNSTKLSPIDLVAKKFAEYCSYRFQNKTEIGRSYRRDFEKINLPKIDTEFCLPETKIDPAKKILFDSFYNFICIAVIISAVDSILACKRGKNEEHKNSREFYINFLSTILGPLIHGFDSLLITGAKFSLSQTLKTNFVKNLTESISQKSGFKNSSVEKLLKNIEKTYEGLPKIVKNSLKTFATFHALFFLKDMIGGRPIITTTKTDLSRFGNLYYDRNVEIFDLFASSLISSTALGFFSLASEKISDKIYESINAPTQSNRYPTPISDTISTTLSNSSISPPSIVILTTESPAPSPQIISNSNFIYIQISSTLVIPMPLNLSPSNSPRSKNLHQLSFANERDSLLRGCA